MAGAARHPKKAGSRMNSCSTQALPGHWRSASAADLKLLNRIRRSPETAYVRTATMDKGGPEALDRWPGPSDESPSADTCKDARKVSARIELVGLLQKSANSGEKTTSQPVYR